MQFNNLFSNSQDTSFVISGYIEDGSTGERLIGASLIDVASFNGKITNTYGFFSYVSYQCPIVVEFSYLGYVSRKIRIDIPVDTFMIVQLEPKSIDIEEVTVSARAGMSTQSPVSTHEVSIKKIKQLPFLLGETDVLKGIQLLPGVQSGVEGTSGIYIRGGSNDQNLILLDGVPVYNVNHLFGFFSVFNTDAISNVTLYKGGFPAHYGGRISSVVDINMKEGNNKDFSGNASIGLLSSKLLIQGPLVKDKSSFLISARRSYFDLFFTPIVKAVSGSAAGYYFQDINFKVNHTINPRDKLFLSTYAGKDKYYLKTKETTSYEDEKYINSSKTDVNWGNITTSLRYNHLINLKTFSNIIVNYSRYQVNNILENVNSSIIDYEVEKEKYSFKASSGIQDVATHVNLNYEPNNKHFIKTGVVAYFHFIKPNIHILNTNTLQNTDDSEELIKSYEIAAYIEDDYSIFKTIRINAGLRYTYYLAGESIYPTLEPRLSISQALTNNLSVKAAYSRSSQYLQLLTTSTVLLPTDIWVPATESVKPITSNQYVIGVYYNMKNKLEFEIETYYKDMYNVIEYMEGAIISSSDFRWQDEIVSGKGESYGIEFYVSKTYGKNQGWLSYTISKTDRTFREKNNGEPFPFRYDRRHVVNAVFTYNLSEKTSLGYAWTFMTGNHITLATGEYPDAIDAMPELNVYKTFFDPEYYTQVNGYQIPAYHRLDLSLNRQKIKKERLRTWKFGVYNVYAKRNALLVGIGSDGVKQASLLLMIPFIDYTINF